MLTFIAFVLTVAGGINWLLIGLLQYDFVAGIFGYQGSVFSRLIYILVGAAAVFLVVKLFLDKGSIHVWGFKKAKTKMQNMAAANSDIEAGKEQTRKRSAEEKEQERLRESGYHENDQRYDEDYDYNKDHSSKQDSLFDEHFGKR